MSHEPPANCVQCGSTALHICTDPRAIVCRRCLRVHLVLSARWVARAAAMHSIELKMREQVQTAIGDVLRLEATRARLREVGR